VRVLFEAFEASAPSELVLATAGGLQWNFPSCAVTVPLTVFYDESFQRELSVFLAKASKESIKRFAAKTQKAGSFVYENRNTVDPALITEMLMALLQVNGAPASTLVLQKIVRDEACWDNAEQPWRRSSFWLVLRVAIQRQFCELLDPEEGRICYKFMMCQTIANLMKLSLSVLSPELLSILQCKLGRRLAKLEAEQKDASITKQTVLAQFLGSYSKNFEKVMDAVKDSMETRWAQVQKSSRRIIPPIAPQTLPDSLHLRLSLQNSAAYIAQIPSSNTQREANKYKPTPRISDFTSKTPKKAREFARMCFSLAEFETSTVEKTTPKEWNDDMKCVKYAEIVIDYMNRVGNFYQDSPDQKSVMLLLVMELWMQLDVAAVNLYPLLRKYAPPFPVNILDPLLLNCFRDMKRLRDIRVHLKDRHDGAKLINMTIFDDPVPGCFAEQFYDQHPFGELQDLHDRIVLEAEGLQQKTEVE
jgi:hypothetical protein